MRLQDGDRAAVLRGLLVDAVAPLAGNPALRERVVEIRLSHDLVIDETSVDVLRDAHGVADTERPREIVSSWRGHLDEHRDEITDPARALRRRRRRQGRAARAARAGRADQATAAH